MQRSGRILIGSVWVPLLLGARLPQYGGVLLGVLLQRERRRRLLHVTGARARAARVWTLRRRVELEAAARFRTLSAELSAHAASDVVIAMATEAAADELRHATLCARLAEHFGGLPLPEPALDVITRRVAPRGLEGREALLYELVALSCVTETLSTALLGALVEAARDSIAKETMHSILRDEVRHSRLGWAFLAESHAAGARDVVAPHLPALLAATLGSGAFASVPADPGDAELAGYGELERSTSLNIVRECFAEVIFPGLARFGIDTSLGERWLAERARLT
jgi:hypothetical protein